MFVSGLTFIRNGLRLGYPFVEAIQSALPLCDEFIVVVGESDDGTREAVENIGDAKIRIIDSVWSKKITPPQAVLAQQTNIGLLQCQGDWVVYVQGNELFHEEDHPRLQNLMQEHKDNEKVEGLVVERQTFFGDYNHCYAIYPARYKYTVRIFKPWMGVYSVKDAMTFAVFEGYGRDGRDLKCIDTGVDLYRYGAVMTAEAMTAKWSEAPHAIPFAFGEFALQDYYKTSKQFIRQFRGTHPSVMEKRIQKHEFWLDWDSPEWNLKLGSSGWKRIVESFLYKIFGMPRWRIKRSTLINKLVAKSRSNGY